MTLRKNYTSGYIGNSQSGGGIFDINNLIKPVIQFVSSYGQVVNNLSSLAITIPSGIQSGDLILAMVAGGDATTSLTGTDASNFTTDTSTNNQFIAYKYADGTESSRTLTANRSTSSRWGVLYFVCRNAVWNASVDKDFLSNINPASNPIVTQTAPTNSSILVGLFGGDTNGTDVFVPSQYTELYRLSSGDADMSAGYEIVTSAGTYSRQWTSAASRNINGYINLAIGN
jgi:hypothetical protein